MIRTKLHPACGQERDASNDVVLRRIAMPSDRRTGPVLIDEGHRECVRINARPAGKLRAQRQQEPWKRNRRVSIVRLAEERHAPPRDDAGKLEIRKRDSCYRIDEVQLVVGGYEVLAQLETGRQIVSQQR